MNPPSLFHHALPALLLAVAAGCALATDATAAAETAAGAPGTDEVAPSDQAAYLKVYDMYAPLFAKLTPETSGNLRRGNYERLFDAARTRVRAWEKEHVK